jgi:hypothetical protein
LFVPMKNNNNISQNCQQICIFDLQNSMNLIENKT